MKHLTNLVLSLSILRGAIATQYRLATRKAEKQNVRDWRNTLHVPVPSIDGELDGLTDEGLEHLLRHTKAGIWRPSCLDILPELNRLQARPAPSTIALREMVASEAGTFSVAAIDEEPAQELFPNGAPRSWADHEARARFALAEAAMASHKRWEWRERPFDEASADEAADAERRGELSVTDLAADDGDFEMEGEFDEGVGGDIDDRRWETPGYVLDPNWSTCPAVVDDAGLVNDLTRYKDDDGAQPAARNVYDRKAELQAFGRHIDELLKLRMPARRQGRLQQLRRGVALAIDSEVDSRLESIKRNADNTAWMGHGRAARDHSFMNVVGILAKGQTTMLLRRKGALGFLSWLRHCWDQHVESLNRRGMQARNKASAANDKTMACGRDYHFSRPHMQLLRAYRADILNAWSWVSPKATTYELGLAWVLRQAAEAKPPRRGAGTGARSEEAFWSAHQAAASLFADVPAAGLRTVGSGENGTKLAYDGGAETKTVAYWRDLGIDHDFKVSGGADYTAIERVTEVTRLNVSNPRREAHIVPDRTPEIWPVSPAIHNERLKALKAAKASS